MPPTLIDPADPAVIFSDPALGGDALVHTLSRLVAARSVNYGFNSASRASDVEGAYEVEVANAIVELLASTPAEVSVVEFAPGRPSVGAVLRGANEEPRLILNGHADTVPVDDVALWSSEPFAAEVRDGYVYGRGACDMKGGLAVQIAVARYLSAFVDRMKGSLVLHFAAGEECGEPGTLSLLEAGLGGDFGITTEPTQLQVCTATRGAFVVRVRIHGRSAHASSPQFGLNPFDRLPAVLEAMREYERDVRTRTHPLLPSPTCTATMVHGGVKENAIPDSCDVIFDRRLLPGESIAAEVEDIAARLASVAASDPDTSIDVTLSHSAAAAEIDPTSAFATKVSAAAESIAGVREPIRGAPFGSDVQVLVNEGGVEAVTFGPGDIAECHCPDERVAVQELTAASRTIAHVAGDLLF